MPSCLKPWNDGENDVPFKINLFNFKKKNKKNNNEKIEFYLRLQHLIIQK